MSSNLDLLALGECMVRLSPPGHGRIEYARTLEVDVGGGEYNVAYALARLGLRTGFASRLPNSPLAEIILNHARAVGMDVGAVCRVPFDGVGRRDRVGLYFAEIGTGVRGGQAIYDRGNSAASAMSPADIDWKGHFSLHRPAWLHSGGIFAVLSESTRETLRTAAKEARDAGIRFSYDLNFRSALSSPEEAARINREFVGMADLCVGSHEGFRCLLGMDRSRSENELVQGMFSTFPNLRYVAGTDREIHQANRHTFRSFACTPSTCLQGLVFEGMEVEDRVGTGDAFAAGLLFGLIRGISLQQGVNLGAGLAALVHSTRGDVSQFNLSEVEALLRDTRGFGMSR